MHGRKRTSGGPSPELIELQDKKLVVYRKLLSIAFSQHAGRIYTPEALSLNAQFLTLNPDVYTLWNYRRNALLASTCVNVVGLGLTRFQVQRQRQHSPPVSPPPPPPPHHHRYHHATATTTPFCSAPLPVVVAAELQLTQAGIARNPKSYYAWYHRRWVLGRWGAALPVPQRSSLCAAELALCGQLLDADERNFLCWQYRMWVAEALQAQLRCPPCDASENASPPPSLVATDAPPLGTPAAGDDTGILPADPCQVLPAEPLPVAAGSRTGETARDISSSADAADSAAAAAATADAVAELAYTTERIKRNFSNYSAWHYRTRLLTALHGCGGSSDRGPPGARAVKDAKDAVAPPLPPEEAAAAAAAIGAPAPEARSPAPAPGSAPVLLPLDVLAAELRLVREAVFTEPDDQSPWFYRRWLLSAVVATAAAGARLDVAVPCAGAGAAAAALEEDVGALRELAAAEPGSKWPLLAIAQGIEALLAVLPLLSAGASGGGDSQRPREAALLAAELAELYRAVPPRLDPLHATYYATRRVHFE